MAANMRISQIKSFQPSNKLANHQDEKTGTEHNFTAREVISTFDKKKKKSKILEEDNENSSGESEIRKVNVNDLSLMKKSNSDEDSEESQVQAVNMETAFEGDTNKKTQLKLSDINTTNDSNQKMKSSGLGDRFKNKMND